MNAHENYIAQETLAAMCKILKEEGGIYQRRIANDIGIDPCLMSKWINGSAKMSDYYNDKIYRYLSKSDFVCFRDSLNREMLRRFDLDPKSRIAFYMKNMNYPMLLEYLIYKLKPSVLHEEERFKKVYFNMLKETLIRKTMDGIDDIEFKIVENPMKNCNERIKEVLASGSVTEYNTIIMEMYKEEKLYKRVAVIFETAREAEDESSLGQKIVLIVSTNIFGRIHQFVVTGVPDESNFLPTSVVCLERYCDAAVKRILKRLDESQTES